MSNNHGPAEPNLQHRKQSNNNEHVRLQAAKGMSEHIIPFPRNRTVNRNSWCSSLSGVKVVSWHHNPNGDLEVASHAV